MFRFLTLAILSGAAALAEIHTMTLRQAINLALKQSPDVMLARLDEQRAADAVRIAKDPFTPKVYGGSGLAYTSGYPMSIEGSAPSIIEIRTQMALFNRQLSYQLAAARENARGAAIDEQSKADDVAYRTATLFLDVQQTARAARSVSGEVENLVRVSESMRTRVAEGRELPIEGKRAELSVAQARQRIEELESNQEYAESSLAIVLGFPAGDRVRAADEEVSALKAPESEQAAIATALENSREIRRLQSQLQARMLELKGYNSARYPSIDLVAQYALLAKHNYVSFFQKFQRNNGQLGASITIPLLIGSGAKGYMGQAQVDIEKLRTQTNEAQNRVTVETAKAYRDVKRAETGREVAKMDLDVAREQVTVLLAQMQEGRVPRASVDQARFTEQEKWIAYYDSENNVEKAKLTLLKQAGTIVAALR